MTRFDGSAWSAPLALSGTAANALSLCLAMNASGQALACWEEDDSLYYSRYAGAAGWAAAAGLESLSGPAARPAAVLLGSGTAMVAWEQEDGLASYSIYSRLML